MRNLPKLVPEEDTPSDSEAPDGDLFAWPALDIFTAWLGMLAAFAGRSIRRAGEESLAGKGEE